MHLLLRATTSVKGMSATAGGYPRGNEGRRAVGFRVRVRVRGKVGDRDRVRDINEGGVPQGELGLQQWDEDASHP
jgi:hypothetical protein